MNVRVEEGLFEELSRRCAEDPSLAVALADAGDLLSECDEISELRRHVLELSEPEPATFTTT